MNQPTTKSWQEVLAAFKKIWGYEDFRREHPLLEETPGDWKSRLHKRSPPARTL
ncbi:MAG: hypothetical protein V7L23_17745 [Nostoc sp.]|uniref:hypothetical protein n=1 Tax=Nostoc sp. TaxID=1180 RepID=UPI002FEFE3C2